MGTWQKNRCPRCGGRMFVDNDIDGWYEQCLNCSFRNELKDYVASTRTEAVKVAPDRAKHRYGG